MWGSGARDEFTIPSLFGKGLEAKGVHAQVVNFGEGGYVSTQEVIQLLRALQRGNIPDLAVFYDGFNDTYSAFQNRKAGLPENEINRVREFNSSKRVTLPLLRSLIANNFSSVQILRQVLGQLGKSDGSARVAQDGLQHSIGQMTAVDKALANDVLDLYEKNIELVRSLAERYSFKVLFYWQPTVFQKKELTKYEEEERLRSIDIATFFDFTYKLLNRHEITRNPESVFHDLSRVFAESREPLFVDRCHLGEIGNEYIAGWILRDAIPLLEQMKFSCTQRSARNAPSVQFQEAANLIPSIER
jgi:lysophospholipase L1-like esterase